MHGFVRWLRTRAIKHERLKPQMQLRCPTTSSGNYIMTYYWVTPAFCSALDCLCTHQSSWELSLPQRLQSSFKLGMLMPMCKHSQTVYQTRPHKNLWEGLFAFNYLEHSPGRCDASLNLLFALLRSSGFCPGVRCSKIASLFWGC